MANALYKVGAEALLDGSINVASDNIKAVLVDTGAYTVNLSTHRNLSDIASGARIATSGNLASKTVVNSVFDAADTVLTAVSGTSVEALVLYKDTGTASTSRLLAFIDSAGATLPFTPNGSDVTVNWDNSANKIFALA